MLAPCLCTSTTRFTAELVFTLLTYRDRNSSEIYTVYGLGKMENLAGVAFSVIFSPVCQVSCSRVSTSTRPTAHWRRVLARAALAARVAARDGVGGHEIGIQKHPVRARQLAASARARHEEVSWCSHLPPVVHCGKRGSSLCAWTLCEHRSMP